MEGEVIRNPDGSFKAFKTADGGYNFQLSAGAVNITHMTDDELRRAVMSPEADQPESKPIKFREFL